MAFPVDNAFVDDGGSVRYNHRTPSSLRPWELVEGPAELDVEEVVLEPGDVLCLPGGTWHAAKAIGYSLALNLAFTPLPFGQILQAVLAHAVQDRVEWRRGLPVAPGADGMPGEVRDYAAARLREAGAILEGLAGDPSLLEPAWRDLVEAPLHGEPAPVAAPAGQAGAAPRSAAATGGFDGRMTCSIPVGGLQAAIAWYREVLGAEPVSTVPGFGWAQLTSPVVGVSLGLSEMPTGGVVPNFGVHDLDAMRARLEAQGVAFEGDTQVIPGLVKLATFLDPFGNRLMMYQDLGTTQE